MLWGAARVSITDFYGLSGMGFYISIVYRTTVPTTPSQQAKQPKCQGSFQLLQRKGAKTCKRCWSGSASSAASYLARISRRHCHITLAAGIGRKTNREKRDGEEEAFFFFSWWSPVVSVVSSSLSLSFCDRRKRERERERGKR